MGKLSKEEAARFQGAAWALQMSGLRRQIMPFDKKQYPIHWSAIAFDVKQRAGWKCQKCGKQCRKPGEKFDTHKNTLTVAHLNHQPMDIRPDNLMAMCAPCHLRYDAKHHAETRKKKTEAKNDNNNKGNT